LITQNSEKEELVTELMIIAREELEHLQMDDLISKGLSLGRERKDHYVNELFIHEERRSVMMLYVNVCCFRL
jgi:tRNA-(ms[2]io[6]A)-hydroxylase